MSIQNIQRKFSTGAEIQSNGVHFRVYAPQAEKIEISHEVDKDITFFELESENNGYFGKKIEEFSKNSLYRFRIDNSDQLMSDPTSRFQPQGPLGPSQVIDTNSFQWSDQDWKGLPLQGQILYEMHIGTFTQEGTFSAAEKELKELADLGVTVLEIMPINDFPGKFGWGYDGVNLYAPTRLYGTPDDVKSFINEAHKLKIAVLLDVVYNHFGPHGNFMSKFSEDYFLTHKNTDWGRAINFNNLDIRKYFLENARYWIEEYHFDGLRIDATQNMYSDTKVHILEDICKTAKLAGRDRNIIVIGENEEQRSIIIRPLDKGGYGFDGLWNDDFHHTAMARLTGARGAYYTDYKGTPQEFISALKYGFLFQGQFYVWQGKKRGTNAFDLFPHNFINFIQNHDQIANSGTSQRIHFYTDQGNLKAMTCLLLLAPSVPMLFQGQEFASSSPFFYFADHSDGLNNDVEKGRKESLAQFDNLATHEMQQHIQDPGNPITFMKSKLNFNERKTNEGIYSLHKDLLALKKNDVVFNDPNVKIDGATLNPDSFVIRFFGSQEQRLMIINFGIQFELNPAPEPLLAPPEGYEWVTLWSSDNNRYNGQGIIPINSYKVWRIYGHNALILSLSKGV